MAGGIGTSQRVLSPCPCYQLDRRSDISLNLHARLQAPHLQLRKSRSSTRGLPTKSLLLGHHSANQLRTLIPLLQDLAQLPRLVDACSQPPLRAGSPADVEVATTTWKWSDSSIKGSRAKVLD